MPNKILASEWLNSAKKYLEVAKLLFEDSHFNDIVGIQLQQSIERSLKAILAFNNKTIIRSHDLTVLFDEVSIFLYFDSDLKQKCDYVTDLYQDNRYPGGGINFLPSDNEIKMVIEATDNIYKIVYEYVNKT